MSGVALNAKRVLVSAILFNNSSEKVNLSMSSRVSNSSVKIFVVVALLTGLVACGSQVQVSESLEEDEVQVSESLEEDEVQVSESLEEDENEILSTSDLFEAVKGGVARLEITACDGDSLGTGFMISDSQIVTNAHVVDGAEKIIAVIDDEVALASVLALDLDRDLALLQTDVAIGNHHFSLGDFEYRTGDEVSVIGFPRGLDITLTTGTISNDSVRLPEFDLLTFLQIDAAANPGNSGGPVLNTQGNVIGILSMGIDQSEGLNFAISVKGVDKILTSWQDNEPLPMTNCSNGSGGETDNSLFEELLTLVEEGEAVLESEYRDSFDEAHGLFLSCADDYNWWSPSCHELRDLNAERSEAFLEEIYNTFPSIRARIFALPPTYDNPAVTRAKDAYIAHLDAWQEIIRFYLRAYSAANQEELVSISEEQSVSLLIDEITATFRNLCRELGNAQLERNESLEERIVDICDD